ncbi:MAG TPA: hypothetical protein VFG51_00380 [Candidatus Saccharimonadia bacterium]|nr:hypothetical protein [Candidatus Saccharimonadia bacterium]
MRTNSAEHDPSKYEFAYMFGAVTEDKKDAIVAWANRQRGVKFATKQVESDGTDVNIALQVDAAFARDVDEALRNLEGVMSVIFVWRPFEKQIGETS